MSLFVLIGYPATAYLKAEDRVYMYARVAFCLNQAKLDLLGSNADLGALFDGKVWLLLTNTTGSKSSIG